MSNPEKMKVDETEGEKEDSDEQWSDAESAMREIVCGLPALKISKEVFGVTSTVEDEEEARVNAQAVVPAEEAPLNEQAVVAVEEARLNEQAVVVAEEGPLNEQTVVVAAEARLKEQAVVAAELVVAAAHEAVMKERNEGKKKKVRRPRKTMKLNDQAGGSAGQGGEVKKPRRKTSELTNPPKGPPVCNICGRGFGSWKAVFGHLRSHKDRNYQGFLPPPTFSTVPRGVMIPGPNSAFGLFTAGGGSSSGVVAAGGGGGGAPEGEGRGGAGIDLNVEPVEEVDHQEVAEPGRVAKFDLNKSPPQDEEDEDNVQ